MFEENQRRPNHVPDRVHDILMNRLRELATIARQTQTVVIPEVDTTIADPPSFRGNRSIQGQDMRELPIPSLSPQIRRTHGPRNAQQEVTTTLSLQAAQLEWRRLMFQDPSRSLSVVNRSVTMNTENLRTNVFWGDRLSQKSERTIRVYATNVNGFSLDRRGGQYDSFCQMLKEVQADVACGQEHNLDTTKSSVRSILYTTTQQHWNRSRMDFSSSPITFENHYKPGGTFVLSVGDITSRLKSRYHDKWGRWTSQTFQGRSGRLITFISAYQVVTDKPTRGTTTAAAQQMSLLLQSRDSETSPRVAFRRDLQEYVLSCKADGHEILLTGDFNESIGSDPNSMLKVMIDCDLVYVMKRHHPTLKLPTTYARGRRCLDYVLASEQVAVSVERAGYESFNARFATDHRSYFVDLSIDSLFGIQVQQLAKHEPRILQSANLKQVTTYLEKKHEYLCSHNFFERVRRLHLPGDRHQLAEKLDKDLLDASLAAEQTIPRFREPQWSIKLATLRKKAQVLQKVLSKIRNHIENEEVILSNWLEVTNNDQLPSSLRECSIMLKITKQEIAALVKQSFQRRDQELKEKIDSLTRSKTTSDRQQAIILRRLKKAEEIKALFRKLKALRQPTQKTGVTRIEIPSVMGADPKTWTEDWIQIDLPDQVAHHLRDRNRQHFGQAAGTPFTVPPLSLELGFDGQGPAAEDILLGNYTYAGDDHHMQLLIQHLRLADMLNEDKSIAATISENAFRGKLKAWRESTATSPSGMHLGHYKALVNKHQFSVIPADEEEDHKQNRERLDRIQQDLREAHLTLLNYALFRGYSYRRWRKVANAILFKDPGVIKIHRTRVIHLYEADYNLALGIKWRAAIFKAEIEQTLHRGQFGSRPRRNAIDPVFIEELQLEVSRLSRKTLAQTNYDATACYDRIIPNLASLASRKFGVPKSVTASNSRTLERASYHVRTDLGLADESYQHSQESPIYGTGQGSSNSPAIWCFISSILYDCYDQVATPASYSSPDYSHNVEIGMVGFVDDSNGQTNFFHTPESPETRQLIRQALRENAQHWATLLGITGGALELSKCSIHVATWEFTNHGAPVLIIDKASFSDLQVQDPTTDQWNTLPYLSPFTSHKTLGHHKEPAGSQRSQLRELVKKSTMTTAFLERLADEKRSMDILLRLLLARGFIPLGKLSLHEGPFGKKSNGSRCPY